MKWLILLIALACSYTWAAEKKLNLDPKKNKNILFVHCENKDGLRPESTLVAEDFKHANLQFIEDGEIITCPLILESLFDKRKQQTNDIEFLYDRPSSCSPTSKNEKDIRQSIKLGASFEHSAKIQSARMFIRKYDGGPDCKILNIDMDQLKLNRKR